MIENISVSDKPLFRLIIPFIAGLLTGYYLYLNSSLLLVIISVYSFFLLRFIITIKKYIPVPAVRYDLLLVIFLSAYLYMSFHLSIPDIPKVNTDWEGYVTESPEYGEKYNKVVLKISFANDDPGFHMRKQKVLLLIKKQNNDTHLRIGDEVHLKARLDKIKNMGNPYEFDYKRYLQCRNIHYRAFITHNDLIVTDSAARCSLLRTVMDFRSELLEWFKNGEFNDDELSVLSALTLGYKDLLSDELKETYSDAGAIHVMAVSGLHVGILYMILLFLLRFPESIKVLRISRFLLIIIIIWLFAVFTGMTPSVVRSSAMFSFYNFGNLISRRSSMYNILALSAFVILLVNPMVIFDVGFQFSYIAVLSIIFFQPQLYKLFSFKHLIFDRIYQLLTVSIAAQIGTLPLALFYFHQFPVYFWLTNILLIPLVFLVICTAIISIILFIMGIQSGLMISLLNYQLVGLNQWVGFIDNLPFATIKNINLQLSQAIVLSAFILYAAILIINYKPKGILVVLILITCFLLIETYNLVWVRFNSTLIFYNSSKDVCIGYHRFAKSDIILKSYDSTMAVHYEWIYKNDLLRRRNSDRFDIVNLANQDLSGNSNLILSLNKINICIAEAHLLTDTLNESINILYISGNRIYPNSSMIGFYDPEIVILGGNVSYFRRQKWKAIIGSEQLKIVDLNESGAYKINFRPGIN